MITTCFNLSVIPAKAGIQFQAGDPKLDPSLRWDDGGIGVFGQLFGPNFVADLVSREPKLSPHSDARSWLGRM